MGKYVKISFQINNQSSINIAQHFNKKRIQIWR